MTSLRSVTLDELTIDDEGSLAGVDLYRRLAAALRRSEHRFLVPEDGARITWDRVLFLNLTYGSGQPEAAAQEASDGGGSDVLCDDHIAADEVGHVAWHHVVGRELRRLAADPSAPISAEALFFSESIASACVICQLQATPENRKAPFGAASRRRRWSHSRTPSCLRYVLGARFEPDASRPDRYDRNSTTIDAQGSATTRAKGTK